MLARIAALLRIQPPVVDNRGLLWGSGADYPTLGDDGWQTGAIWCNTTGDAGTSLYVNEGDVASCNFVAVDTTAGASAGAITFDDNVTGPLISIETADPTNDSYTTPFIITGAYSSSADNALVVSSTNTRPVSFLFEDSGDVLGGDIRAGLFRLLLTVDQTAACTINALRAQIKANDLVDITSANAVVAPFTGYLELAGTGARTLAGHVACVRAALEEGASGTTTVGEYLAGFEATLNSTRVYAGAGVTAAFLANISGGASLWQYGLYLEAGAVLTTGVHIGNGPATGVSIGTSTIGVNFAGVTPTCIYVTGVGTVTSHVIDMIDAYTGMVIETGTYASATSKGVTLVANNWRPVSFLFDDGGVLLGDANYRAVLSRIYIGETQTGQIALRAIRGQVKVATTKNLNIGTNEMNAINGVEGYIEMAGTHTIGANTRVAAVHGLVEVNDNITLTAGGKLVGLYAELSQVTAKTVDGIGTCGILVDRLDSDHATNQAAWTSGLIIADSATTTAIGIGVCTSGIVLTGVTGRAIDIQTTGVVRMGIEGTGVPLNNTYPYGFEVHNKTISDFAQPATGVSASIYARYEMGFDQVTATGHAAMFAKLRVKKDLEDGVHAGIYALVEASEVGTLISGTATTQTCAGHFCVEFDTNMEIDTGHLNGIVVDSSIHAGATISSATVSAIRIKKAGSNANWPTGIAVSGCDLGMTVTWASASTLGSAADPLYGGHTNDSGIQACVSVGTAATESTVDAIGSHVAFLSNVSLEAVLEQFSLFGGAVYICTLGVAQATVDAVACGVTGYIRNIDGGKMETVQYGVRGCIYTHTSQEGVRQSALHAAIIDKGAKTEASALFGLSMVLEATADNSCQRDAIYIQTVNSTQDWDSAICLQEDNITYFARFNQAGGAASACKPAQVVQSSITDSTTADALVKIEIDSTAYYLVAFTKAHVTNESA